MQNKMASKIAFILSIIAVVASGLVSLMSANLWFAGTQWMLIGIVLAVWALFLKK